MLHYAAGDLPFYYALADAFTICDAYHCSTMTQTQPNRLHLFTGCNGGGGVGGEPEMSNYGEDDTPCADMAQDRKLRRKDRRIRHRRRIRPLQARPTSRSSWIDCWQGRLCS